LVAITRTSFAEIIPGRARTSEPLPDCVLRVPGIIDFEERPAAETAVVVDGRRYPEFLQKGWQIGCGPTEAMCKTTTARLKRCGMRWDADNADALMALAGLEQSDQWKPYWQTRLKPTG
jgi:hypothetical protein